ncbi:MAG: lipopolysaccharide heptosyltransferase II [Desulfobacterium sp.]|nr:lipopolysaccharide heptosyltransferase II [Desulfobacterium sp.]MBU3949104.1 lipopolysaccharide heptosyltransferase II [Pseudomonadota bacterium]MBU4010564.1 lipopolysaccharide heptosyltransferase II [Pseudomonadota bacterium]MBU4034930.1 lipopolysaccharide heptosyltransferase II [Pseudomonadota bacterium]
MLLQQLDKSDINTILIRATNWVGDAVMTLPALEAVRENFPSARITVLARPWVAPLFENHPAVNDVLIFQKHDSFIKDLAEIKSLIESIKEKQFDLALLFQNAFEAAIIAYLGGIKYRVGFDSDGRGLLLTHAIKRTNEIFKIHQVEYYLSILKALGYTAESRNPAIHIAEDVLAKADNLLKLNGINEDDFLLGFAPGAIFGNAKKWPPERFAEIGDLAAQRWGAKTIIMGSKKEQYIGSIVTGLMRYNPVDFCGTTSLEEAIAIISRCNFFLSNDSGLMHVAAALGVPTLAIFGSTDHVATGPRGPKTRILKHNIDCAPCMKQECPTDFKCMLSITPEEVWQEMEQFRYFYENINK